MVSAVLSVALTTFLSITTAPPYGAPLPKGVELVRQTTQRDAHGQTVEVAVYRTTRAFAALRSFYRKRLRRRRWVKIQERRESIDPKYVLDPQDPSSSVEVLRIINTHFSSSWAGLFVRPLDDGSMIVALQRRPPPEVSGAQPPDRFAIPMAVFETEGLRPLVRPF